MPDQSLAQLLRAAIVGDFTDAQKLETEILRRIDATSASMANAAQTRLGALFSDCSLLAERVTELEIDKAARDANVIELEKALDSSLLEMVNTRAKELADPRPPTRLGDVFPTATVEKVRLNSLPVGAMFRDHDSELCRVLDATADGEGRIRCWGDNRLVRLRADTLVTPSPENEPPAPTIVRVSAKGRYVDDGVDSEHDLIEDLGPVAKESEGVKPRPAWASRFTEEFLGKELRSKTQPLFHDDTCQDWRNELARRVDTAAREAARDMLRELEVKP